MTISIDGRQNIPTMYLVRVNSFGPTSEQTVSPGPSSPCPCCRGTGISSKFTGFAFLRQSEVIGSPHRKALSDALPMGEVTEEVSLPWPSSMHRVLSMTYGERRATGLATETPRSSHHDSSGYGDAYRALLADVVASTVNRVG